MSLRSAPHLEQHPHGATVYLTGTLSERVALLVGTMIADLPPACRTVRLDVLGVERFEAVAVRTLSVHLARFESARGGHVAVCGEDAVLTVRA
jgi:ABC-type transporter Mla MlaB component